MNKQYDNTKNDWNFTNHVHEHLALEQIYSLVLKEPKKYVQKATYNDDVSNGIDYYFYYTTKNNKTPIRLNIQERFRKNSQFTKDSQEFTIRYARPNSQSEKQQQSEFFKIKADRLIYGITNQPEKISKPIEDMKFIRFCIVDIKALMNAIDNKDILIDFNEDIYNQKHSAYIKNDKIYAILKRNKEQKDGNSNFLIFNANDILTKLPHLNIIKVQQGYSNDNNLSLNANERNDSPSKHRSP